MGDKKNHEEPAPDVEEEKSDQESETNKPKLGLNFSRLILYSLGLLVIFLGLIIFLGYSYLSSFGKQTSLKPKEVASQVKTGLKNPIRQDYLNFLILGLDQRENGDSLLTDTILISSINVNTGNYLLFSLPRDLWLENLKTKINALYYYGNKNEPEKPTSLIENQIGEIIGQKIDHTILLKMENIEQLVNLLGGVEIDVKNSFVDKEFPKDDGSNEVMTIEFEKGKQTLTGDRALQYIRSRKSGNQQEGTDDARQKRQKQIIIALKDKLMKNKIIFLDPKKVGQLYYFANNDLTIYPKINLETLASFYKVGFKLMDAQQSQAELSWRGENSLLTVGTDPYYQTWILTPKDDNWQLIKDYFTQNLP